MPEPPSNTFAAATAPALVEQSVMICPACRQPNDVWADACACGETLLPDTRKLKLSSTGGDTVHRLQRRAKALASSSEPDQWEQAVRDLAALRAHEESHPHTDEIARLLLRLERLGEAVVESRSLIQADKLPADIVVSLSQRYEALGDLAGAHGWLDCALGQCGDDLKSGLVPLACERARLLADHGRTAEALSLLHVLSARLDEAVQQTERSGGAAAAQLLVSGDRGAYAASYWSVERKAVKKATQHVTAAVESAEHARHEAAKHDRAVQREAQGKTHWWQP